MPVHKTTLTEYKLVIPLKTTIILLLIQARCICTWQKVSY